MFGEEDVFLDVDVKDKDELLAFISHKAYTLGVTDDEKALDQDFHDREAQFSTGLQDGFAIPHARTDNVKKVTIMFIRNKSDIAWETMDDQPVRDVFALMVPAKEAGNLHLQMISTLATCLLEDDFMEYVKTETDKKKLVEYINQKMKEDN